MKMDNEKFIVAEVTKNWPSGTPVNNLLSQQFETVINVNVQRGYKLIDWKINVSSHPDLLTETIIAIFEFLGSEPEGKEAVGFGDFIINNGYEWIKWGENKGKWFKINQSMPPDILTTEQLFKIWKAEAK
jgi:hypothetical protein